DSEFVLVVVDQGYFFWFHIGKPMRIYLIQQFALVFFPMDERQEQTCRLRTEQVLKHACLQVVVQSVARGVLAVLQQAGLACSSCGSRGRKWLKLVVRVVSKTQHKVIKALVQFLTFSEQR